MIPLKKTIPLVTLYLLGIHIEETLGLGSAHGSELYPIPEERIPLNHTNPQKEITILKATIVLEKVDSSSLREVLNSPEKDINYHNKREMKSGTDKIFVTHPAPKNRPTNNRDEDCGSKVSYNQQERQSVNEFFENFVNNSPYNKRRLKYEILEEITRNRDRRLGTNKQNLFPMKAKL